MSDSFRRIALQSMIAWLAVTNRFGHGKSDAARDDRQPALLLLDGGGVSGGAREADRQLVAEAERAVVDATGNYGAHRELGPLRELSSDQAPHQRLVDRNHLAAHGS